MISSAMRKNRPKLKTEIMKLTDGGNEAYLFKEWSAQNYYSLKWNQKFNNWFKFPITNRASVKKCIELYEN